MYEYRFIVINTGGSVFMSNNRDAKYREVIQRETQAGWRLVTAIPTEFAPHGGVTAMDLVFEREVPDKKEETQ